jgi:formate hydrogenlyase transcriptional activator
MLTSQITLFRVLQEREFERIGSTKPVQVDVRVLAATNRDLAADVEDGDFPRALLPSQRVSGEGSPA